jgi:hypothetical protein
MAKNLTFTLGGAEYAAAPIRIERKKLLRMFESGSVDGVLYDPPYSQRQVKECYDDIGQKGFDGKMNFWSDSKNEVARIVKPGGKVLCFGWNSMGCGMKRGFTMTRILIVPHGGTRNDTICTVEIKNAVLQTPLSEITGGSGTPG